MTPLLSPTEQQAAEQAADSAIMPEGLYVCRVADVERWTSGKSLVWKFRIAKGQPHAGHEFWTWTGLEENSIWKTKEILTALGFGLDADPDAICGTPAKIQVTVEVRKDTGEPTNRVKKVFAYEGPDLPSEWSDDDDDPFGGKPDTDDDLV